MTRDTRHSICTWASEDSWYTLLSGLFCDSWCHLGIRHNVFFVGVFLLYTFRTLVHHYNRLPVSACVLVYYLQHAHETMTHFSFHVLGFNGQKIIWDMHASWQGLLSETYSRIYEACQKCDHGLYHYFCSLERHTDCLYSSQWVLDISTALDFYLSFTWPEFLF